MILRMFAVKDHKMNLFMNPMFFTSRGQAIRVVTDEVNRRQDGSDVPPTTLQTHPEDVDLFEIGEFDSESGVIVAPKEPVLVAKCKDLVVGRS
jgi:hypothetical protein